MGREAIRRNLHQLTAGEVSRLCSVAPRTVAKWIDKGMLAAYRLPSLDGTGDRRIRYADLAKFLLDHHIPIDVEYALSRGIPVENGEGKPVLSLSDHFSLHLVSPDQVLLDRLAGIKDLRESFNFASSFTELGWVIRSVNKTLVIVVDLGLYRNATVAEAVALRAFLTRRGLALRLAALVGEDETDFEALRNLGFEICWHRQAPDSFSIGHWIGGLSRSKVAVFSLPG